MTLIEVLVTAALLLLLLGMVFPTLQSSRRSGQLLLCSAHLKQLAAITEIYVHTYRRYPQGFCSLSSCTQTAPASGFAGHPTYDRPGWWWFDFLEVDRSAGGILWCPARRPMNSPFQENVLWSNYGINLAVAKWASVSDSGEFQGLPMSKEQILRPSEKMLYTDSGYGVISWKAASSLPNPFDFNPLRYDSFYFPGLKINRIRIIHPEQQTDAVDGRHPRAKSSIAYADGHVAAEKAERFAVQAALEGNLKPSYFWTAGR